jgi:Tir chaperone protein (CesT) family
MKSSPILLEELAAQLGLTELALDENGSVQIVFDDTLVSFEFDEGAGRLLIYAAIGEVPVARRERVYGLLLRENLFRGGEGDPVFAVLPESGSVLLQTALSLAGLDLARLLVVLEGLLNRADQWTVFLKSEVDSPSGETSGALEFFGAGDPSRFV